MPSTVPENLLDKSMVVTQWNILDKFLAPILKCLSAKNKLAVMVNSKGQSHQARNMISYRNTIATLSNLAPETPDIRNSIDVECFGGVECYIFRYTEHVNNEETQVLEKGNEQKEKVIFYFHAGGWCALNAGGNPNAGFCKLLAKTLNVTVVSVEYKLAPEHIFSDDLSKRCAFTDCYNATVGYLSKYAGNVTSYGIAGDSAGGNLTLTVGLKICNSEDFSSKLPFPSFLAPIYPVTQCLSFDTSSYKTCSYPTLTTKMMVEFAAAYGVGNFSLKMVNFLLKNPNYLRKDFELNDSDRLMESDRKLESDRNLEDANFSLDKYSSTSAKGNNDRIQVDNNLLKSDLAKLQSSALNPYFSPLFASDLMLENVMKRIKNIRFICCEYEVLRDDTLLMYEKFLAVSKKLDSEKIQLTKTVVAGGTHCNLTACCGQPEEYPGHLAQILEFIEVLRTDF